MQSTNVSLYYGTRFVLRTSQKWMTSITGKGVGGGLNNPHSHQRINRLFLHSAVQHCSLQVGGMWSLYVDSMSSKSYLSLTATIAHLVSSGQNYRNINLKKVFHKISTE